MVNMARPPILSVTSVNASPQSILPRPVPMSGVNYAEQGRRQAKQEGIADEQRGLDKQKEAYQAMIKNPAAAQEIARMYGVRYDAGIEKMLQNPQKAQLILDGASMAKGMGISDPTAAQTFTKTYLETGGNLDAAQASIKGMNTTAAPDPIKIGRGGALVNPDGTVVYQSPYQSGGEASRGFRVPAGYKDDGMGGVVPLPGYVPDPLKDPAMPPELRIKLEAVKSGMMSPDRAIEEYSKWSATRGTPPPPPSLQPIPGLDMAAPEGVGVDTQEMFGF